MGDSVTRLRLHILNRQLKLDVAPVLHSNLHGTRSRLLELS